MFRHRRLALVISSPVVLVAAVWGLSLGSRSDAGPGYTYRISTIAGDGSAGAPTEHVPATQSATPGPEDTVYDSHGNLYLLEDQAPRIRKIAPDGTITALVTGTAGDHFRRLAVDHEDRLYVSRRDGHHDVMRVEHDGTLTRVAGGGHDHSDGAPALQAALLEPEGLAFDGSDHLWIAESGHIAELIDGHISLAIGNGVCVWDGKATPAAQVGMCPDGIAFDKYGYLYAAVNVRLLRISPDPQHWVTNVAGDGHHGNSGDGGPAVKAEFFELTDVDVDASGSIYVADVTNADVRVIDDDGTVRRFAGTGTPGFSGDGGDPKAADLWAPVGVTVAGDGSVVIDDWAENRVREVTKHMLPTTVPSYGTTLPPFTVPTVRTTQPIGPTPEAGDPTLIGGLRAGVVAVRGQ